MGHIIFQGVKVPAGQQRSPASIRLKQRLFPYLLRSRRAADQFPACLQVFWNDSCIPAHAELRYVVQGKLVPWVSLLPLGRCWVHWEANTGSTQVLDVLSCDEILHRPVLNFCEECEIIFWWSTYTCSAGSISPWFMGVFASWTFYTVILFIASLSYCPLGGTPI